MAETHKYQFNEGNRAGHNASTYTAFLKTLGINDATKLAKRDASLVKRFLDHFVGNIVWYQKKIETRSAAHKTYAVITVLLAIGIPIVILLLTKAPAEDADTNENVLDRLTLLESKVTIVVVLLLAIHQFATDWLGKANLRKLWHRASSDLQTKFFATEQAGANGVGVVTADNSQIHLTQEYRLKIIEAIQLARETVAKETEDYYAKYEKPNLALYDVLSTSFTNASQLFANFRSKRFDRALENAKAELKAAEDQAKKQNDRAEDLADFSADLAVLNEKADALQRGIDDLRKQYQQATDDGLKKQLNDELTKAIANRANFIKTKLAALAR